MTPDEQALPDEKLRMLANLMSETLALQAIVKQLKQEGMHYDDIDKHLVFFNEVAQATVDAMNRRLKELM